MLETPQISLYSRNPLSSAQLHLYPVSRLVTATRSMLITASSVIVGAMASTPGHQLCLPHHNLLWKPLPVLRQAMDHQPASWEFRKDGQRYRREGSAACDQSRAFGILSDYGFDSPCNYWRVNPHLQTQRTGSIQYQRTSACKQGRKNSVEA